MYYQEWIIPASLRLVLFTRGIMIPHAGVFDMPLNFHEFDKLFESVKLYFVNVIVVG